VKFIEALKAVGAVYQLTTKTKVKSKIKRGLRPSGFPYCGLRDLWQQLNGGQEGENGFLLDYYGGVGTAAHTVFQKYMGATGLVVGNWKCGCGKTTKFSTQNICECGNPMQYEELFMQNGNLRGYTDCLLFLDGKYYVGDYKTSSVKNLVKHRLENVYPTLVNREQVLAYCVSLEKAYKIEISGWFLLYIARDNPQDHVVVGEPFGNSNRLREKAKISTYNLHYTIVTDLLNRKWTTEDENYRQLVKERPCKNHGHYKDHMGQWSSCPLGDSQVCWSKRLDSIIEDSK
jgi:hypothetical protein